MSFKFHIPGFNVQVNIILKRGTWNVELET